MATVVQGSQGDAGLFSLLAALIGRNDNKIDRTTADLYDKRIQSILGEFDEKAKGKYTNPIYGIEPDLSQYEKALNMGSDYESQPNVMGYSYLDAPEEKQLGYSYLDQDNPITKISEMKSSPYPTNNEEGGQKTLEDILFEGNRSFSGEVPQNVQKLEKEGGYFDPLKGEDLAALEDEYRNRAAAAQAGLETHFRTADLDKMFVDERRFKKGGGAGAIKSFQLVDENNKVALNKNGRPWATYGVGIPSTVPADAPKGTRWAPILTAEADEKTKFQNYINKLIETAGTEEEKQSFIQQGIDLMKAKFGGGGETSSTVKPSTKSSGSEKPDKHGYIPGKKYDFGNGVTKTYIGDKKFK